MDLAEVLHVEVEALLGRPREYAPNGGAIPNELDSTRRYLNGYRQLFPDREAPVSVEEFVEDQLGHARISMTQDVYMAARWCTRRRR